MSKTPKIKELTDFEKELAILFMAISFGRMHIDDVLKDQGENAIVLLEKPIKMLDKLSFILNLYKSKVDDIAEKAVMLFGEIESDAKKFKSLNRFEKKLRFDEEGNVIINGLLFSAAMILEHRNLKNKKLRPAYKIAQEIYDVYTKNGKVLDNSKILSKNFVNKMNSI